MQLNGNLLFSYAMLFLIPCAVFYFYHKNRVKNCKIKGATLLQALRILIKNFQAHRGLTAAHIAGTPNLSNKLKQQTHSTHENIRKIADISTELEKSQDWAGITRHWARLATHRSDALDNFDQHCKIIASTSTLMQTVAYTHKLARSEHNAKDSLWFKLLCLAELLGQIRANGIYYLSLEHHNHYACTTRLKSGLEELTDDFNSNVMSQHFTTQDLRLFVELKEFIYRHIIDKKGLISQELFYNEASKVIDVVHEYLDDEIMSLGQAPPPRFSHWFTLEKLVFKPANTRPH